jgi:hypothetical protein
MPPIRVGPNTWWEDGPIEPLATMSPSSLEEAEFLLTFAQPTHRDFTRTATNIIRGEITSEEMTPKRAKTIKKERHLNSSERRMYHRPGVDKEKLVDVSCDDICASLINTTKNN